MFLGKALSCWGSRLSRLFLSLMKANTQVLKTVLTVILIVLFACVIVFYFHHLMSPRYL